MIPRTKVEEELQARQLKSFEARMKLMDIIISTKTDRKAKKEGGEPFLIGMKEGITSNDNQVSLFNVLKIEK